MEGDEGTPCACSIPCNPQSFPCVCGCDPEFGGCAASPNPEIDHANCIAGTLTDPPPGHVRAGELPCSGFVEFKILQPVISPTGEVGAMQMTSSPRLSRWGSQRGSNHLVDNDDRSTFPDNDPDRLVVRISSSIAQDGDDLRVKLSTTGASSGYDDTGAEMEFDRIGSYFESKPIVLVADADYDALNVGAGSPADGGLNDRTFISSPGGRLVVEVLDASGLKFETPVQTFTNRIKIQNIYLNLSSAEEAAAQACMNENVKRIKEIYAQNHIQVEINPQPIRLVRSIKPFIGGQHGPNNNTYGYVAQCADEVFNGIDEITTFRLVWVSQDHADASGNFGVNLTHPNNRPDVCLLFLDKLNYDPTTAHQTSMVAAHEIGHGLVGAYNHLDPRGNSYLPFHLMCAASASNLIIDGSPDKSAKHWRLDADGYGDPEIMKGSSLCPAVTH